MEAKSEFPRLYVSERLMLYPFGHPILAAYLFLPQGWEGINLHGQRPGSPVLPPTETKFSQFICPGPGNFRAKLYRGRAQRYNLNRRPK